MPSDSKCCVSWIKFTARAVWPAAAKKRASFVIFDRLSTTVPRAKAWASYSFLHAINVAAIEGYLWFNIATQNKAQDKPRVLKPVIDRVDGVQEPHALLVAQLWMISDIVGVMSAKCTEHGRRDTRMLPQKCLNVRLLHVFQNSGIINDKVTGAHL